MCAENVTSQKTNLFWHLQRCLGGFLLSLPSLLSLWLFSRKAPGRQAKAEDRALCLWIYLLPGIIFSSPRRKTLFLPTLIQCVPALGQRLFFPRLQEASLMCRTRPCHKISTTVISEQTLPVSVSLCWLVPSGNCNLCVCSCFPGFCCAAWDLACPFFLCFLHSAWIPGPS